MEHEGKLYLYYTGVRYLEEDPEDTNLCLNEKFVSAQMMITSEDGVHFDNIRDKREIIAPLRTGKGETLPTRGIPRYGGDQMPGIWFWEPMEATQMAGSFYRSADLENWSYVNAVSKSGLGWMWECPDYYETKGGKVLSFSPMGFLKDGTGKRIRISAWWWILRKKAVP